MAQYDVQMDGARDYVLRIIANQGTQNIAANTSVVNWSLVAMGTWGSWGNTATPWSVNIGGHVTSGTLPTYNPNPSQVIASGSTTVSHRADGTQTITVTGWWNSGHGNIGAGTASGPLTLTTIPRASTPTFTVGGVAATAVDAGDSVTINTNRASTDFTHTITWKFGNQTGNIGSGITTSTTWTPPLSMLTEIPSSMNGAVQIITTTFSGSTNVGSKTVNLTLRVPTEAAPDFTTVTHAEATIAPNVNGLIGAYVKDISSLAVAITGVNAKYGASPAQYKIEIAGQTINAQSGTTGVLSQSGALALKGTVTDSRGMSTTKTFTVNVLNYALPAINSASAVRSTVGGVVDANGTYIKVDIAAVVQSLVVGTQKNALTWKIKTRSNGDETPWTEIAPVAEDTITATGYSDDTILGTYTVADSFNVRIEVSDKLGKVSAMELTVATGGTLVHFSHTVDGVGVGKYHEQGSIDALGQIYQNNGKAVIDESDTRLTNARTPLAHNHAAGDINSGTLATTRGGTGVSAANMAALKAAMGVPYAMAAGEGYTGSQGGNLSGIYWDGTVTITFPVGRFTRAPMVVTDISAGGGVQWSSVQNRVTSTTSFTARSMRVGAYPDGWVYWIAVQMTETSGVG